MKPNPINAAAEAAAKALPPDHVAHYRERCIAIIAQAFAGFVPRQDSEPLFSQRLVPTLQAENAKLRQALISVQCRFPAQDNAHGEIQAALASPTPIASPTQEAGQEGRWVEWVEPFIGGEPVYMRVPEKTAIAHAKAAAKQGRPGFIYDSDEQALDDFMVVHWATFAASPATPSAAGEWAERAVEELHEYFESVRSDSLAIPDSDKSVAIILSHLPAGHDGREDGELLTAAKNLIAHTHFTAGANWETHNLAIEAIKRIASRQSESSAQANLDRQENLTSALWRFARDLQNSGPDIRSSDGTCMNSEAMRNAQETILSLWGQKIIPIQ